MMEASKLKTVTEIAVVGLGGVGGYFGFKLAQRFSEQEDVKVTFITRGATYDAVKSKGLILHSAEHQKNRVHPDRLLRTVDDLTKIDLLLVAVKEYDLENICKQLKGKVTDDTVILPLMNGVDVYESIRKVIPQGIVLPACLYVASHIREKGTVEHQGLPGKIIFGNDPRFPEYKPEQVMAIFKQAGIQYEYEKDPFPAIWAKFLFIASFGLVTARYNLPIGKVNEDSVLRKNARQIMQEIAGIAQSKGINLPEDAIELAFQKAATFPYQTPTSLQLDVHSKKGDNELELFAGAILRYGAEMAVITPVTKKIYEEINNS